MSDRFHPLGAGPTAAWISGELDSSGSVFGIPRDLFFEPAVDDRFTLDLRGSRLETPIGVAAGPHTQLAQNLVVSWLCGARVIELKTVQTLDRIEVSKPCIDMPDEGYNIEWSQELTIDQSIHEYLAGWVLIHALHARLGFPGFSPGVLFDLSVGYDLEGLKQPNMHRYLEVMTGGGTELDATLSEIVGAFPEVDRLAIPKRISDSVTVSTLHGCPPDEIGAIAEHLMGSWGLHTAIKLNPTLLGIDLVREILIDRLGWTHTEPQASAFDADIGYSDALELLRQLAASAARRNLVFGIKLCNTLPVVNRRPGFSDTEETAYLSGRPLHALAVELARRLTEDLDGAVSISFAGGADAFNTPSLLAAGLCPVTTCSDILRPGGYLRLRQYLDEIDAAFDAAGAVDLDDLAIRRSGTRATVTEAARTNLDSYAESLRTDAEVARRAYRRDHTKTDRALGLFDCIEAPCTDICSVDQKVPEYMRAVAAGEVDRAAEIIAGDNPLPSILGRACHHPCEPVCTRTHLDQPLAIREIKRYVTDHADGAPPPGTPAPNRPRVAIVGAGPCGLAAAAELARAGVRPTIFEAREEGGGMVSATIPGYRASPVAVQRDLEAIAKLGVETVYNTAVGVDVGLFELFDQGFASVVVAVGAQKGSPLGIEGENCAGVLDGLDFLRQTQNNRSLELGSRIAVIGGGDVAMDCARSARRLTGGRVEILYRRTIDQMPAHPEEIRDLLDEGVGIRELVAPRRVVSEGDSLRTLECAVMALGEADDSGRPKPVEIPGETLDLDLDTVIVAIGQRADLGIFDAREIAQTRAGYLEVDPESLETSIRNVYAGGDLRAPGPSSIVDACGDGLRIAHAILARLEIDAPGPPQDQPPAPEISDLLRRRSHRSPRVTTPRIREGVVNSFVEVIQTLDPGDAVTEASRCLDCDLLCSTCEGVCPNRAILTYSLDRTGDLESIDIDQAPQVAILADFCNHCGNCTTFCPTAGEPWKDKPRIVFDRTEFEAETDNAFMLLTIDGSPAIQGRFNGTTLQAILDGPFDRSAEGSTTETVTMLALLRGLGGSMPHLPRPEAEPEWLVES